MRGRQILILLALLLAVALEWGLLIYIISRPVGEVRPETPLVSARFIAPTEGVMLFQGQKVTVEVETPLLELTGAELWVNGHRALPLPQSMARFSNRWVVTFLWEPSTPASYTLETTLKTSQGDVLRTSPLTVEVVPPLYLCFASDLAGNYDIYRMRADGALLEALIASPAEERKPTQAPDGSIAFAKGDEIWVKSRDGLKFLAKGQEPSFDPNGRYLAFRSNVGLAQELFLLDVGKGITQQLTSDYSFAGQASWSPDGERIAFAALKDGNWDVYIIQRDGGGLIRLTDHPAQDWYPAWSPDGQKIAFVSSREGSHQLYLVNPDGSSLERLTQIPGGVEGPVFSPDGRLIAFTAYTGEGRGFSAREIHLLSLGTRRVWRVTHDNFDETDLAWCLP